MHKPWSCIFLPFMVQAAAVFILWTVGKSFRFTTSTSNLFPRWINILQPLPPVRQQSGPVPLAPLSATPLPKRNSLPPLRAMPSLPGGSEPGISPGAGPAATSAAGGPLAAAGPGLTGLSGCGSGTLGPGSRSGSCSSISMPAHNDSAGLMQPGGSSMQALPSMPEPRGLLGQHSGVLRHSFGRGLAPMVSPATADGAAPLLSTVCRAQIQLYRWVQCCTAGCFDCKIMMCMSCGRLCVT